MKSKKAYAGIDYFRVIAAILVIAIHTSPLASVDTTVNFILTRVIARVAVPFFMMASGFFMLSETGKASGKNLTVYLKKTGMLYVAAIILYLPLNLYHGIPDKWVSVGGVLKSVLFDGTYLHLWYLPAAMLGASIAWMLMMKLGKKWAIVIAGFLYIVGLFGDSYYGFVEKLPVFKAFYQAVFEIFGYARNGLFFAPLFFILGGLLAQSSRRSSQKFCLLALELSLALMIAEGLLLHHFKMQRHDSMYVMLPFCMVFLVRCLLFWNGRGAEKLRNVSASVYIIHPWMIALVAKGAALTKLPWLFRDNTVRFIVVTLASLAAAALFTTLMRIIRPRNAALRGRTDRAWAEINLPGLCHNALAIQKRLPEGCTFMAVVKANAYGHGDVEVSRALNRIGVKAFAVATIDEGIHLRKRRIRGEILVLGFTDPRRAAELSRYRLTQTIVDGLYAAELDSMGKTIRVHIKVDTGMHRLGESSDHAAQIAGIFQCRHLKVTGIFTHLCVSDSVKAEDVAFTQTQIQKFFGMLKELKKMRIALPPVHIQSSYGILNYPELRCSCARVGIALYGAAGEAGDDFGMMPVLSLKTRVVLVRSIPAGESVGYGRQFVASRATRIAVLSIGYSDGVPRDIKNGCVLIRGCPAPIVGRVCMDQLMVDVTDVPDAARGDIATLIGCDGNRMISAEAVAANAGTIPNELLSRLSGRLERIYLRR